MSIPTPYNSLTDAQRLLLGFAAYRGVPIEGSFLLDFAKAFGIEDPEAELEILKMEGFYDSSWGIVDKHLLKVIDWVCSDHTYWPSQFERAGFRHDENMHKLWLAYYSSERGVQEPFPLCRRFKDQIGPLLKEERYYHILDSLSGRDFGSTMAEELKKDLLNDAITEDILNNYEDNLKCYQNTHKARLHNYTQLVDEIAFYRYLATGVEPERRGLRSNADLYAAAIIALYMHDPTTAANLFKDSNDRLLSLPKDLPDNLLAAFFSVLALMKSGQNPEKLKSIKESNDTPAILKLIANLQSAGKNEVIAGINSLKSSAKPLEQQFLFLASRFSNLGNLQGYNNLEHVPNLAIMRNECAPYLHLPEEEKQHLKDMFGGESIVAGLSKEDQWASTLSDLEQLIKLPGQAVNPKLRSRVKFVMYDNSILGLREQKLRPDGSWGEEKLLSYSQYIEGGYSFMDETDEQIALALKDYNRHREHASCRSEAEAILPFLIGTDRVYGPHGPLRIDAEKPRIQFRIVVDHIVAESNVDIRKEGGIYPTTVKTDEDGNCTVISPNPQQRRILELLLKSKELPVTAASYLVDLSEKMSGILDVDASSLLKLNQAPTLQGTGKIIVQIKPDASKNSFLIEWQALPVDSGEIRFSPGDGVSEYIEADEEGKPYRVIRDLQKEQDNLNDLTDFITNTPSYSVFNNTQLEIRETENLLPLLEFLHDRPDDYAMEWPEGSEIKFKGKAGASCWEIGLTTDIQWFGLEGNVNVGGTSIPLKKVLKEGDFSEEAGEFVRIGEKEYIRISKAIQRQLAALQGMMTGGSLQVSKYQVGKLAEVLGMGGLKVTQNEDYQKQLGRMKEAYEMIPEVPANLNATLRDYQLDGYRWMSRLAHWGAGGCLADDMGLGKTVQTIAFMLSQADKGPSLVIAPTSVVPNWEREIRKFAPDLTPIIINHVGERAMVVRNTNPWDIVIASYGILTNSTDALLEKEWNVICLDEAHQIKNRWTKVSKAAMDLKGSSRIILTGTPVQNSLNDLWNLFQFINPGMLGNFDHFRETYSSKNVDEATKRLESLKLLTQPFILRRTKDQVLDELPKKTEIDYLVSLSPDEMASYEKMRSYFEGQFMDGGGKADISVFEGLTKLRLACCSLSIQDAMWKAESSKLQELRYLLQHIYNADSHMLIFSQFTTFLGLAKKVLKDIGIPFLYLDGGTSLEQRAELVEQFQKGECNMFLISLKAGGLGLNLTAANYVILLDPWWNPSIEEQAIDRAYRIGQTQDVTVIRMLAEHTIEQKIVQLQDKKRNISDNILQGTGSSNTLTYEEIMEMVSPF